MICRVNVNRQPTRAEFVQRLVGLGELRTLDTYRAVLAEALGTFMLLFLGLSAHLASLPALGRHERAR